MTCGFCQSKESRLIFNGYGFDDQTEAFDVVKCLSCGLAQTSPRPIGSELAKYYQAQYYGNETQKISQKKFIPLFETMVQFGANLRSRAVIKSFNRLWAYPTDLKSKSNPPKILDIGCGRGTLLKSMKQFGLECEGTEIGDYVSTELADLGIPVHKGPIETLKLPDDHYDIVHIWHVYEHVENPKATLHEIERILKPGGLLVIAVPHFTSFQRLTFARHWFHLDIPRHLYHFSLNFLQRELEKRSFSICSKSTLSIEQNVYGFIQSAQNMCQIAKPNALYEVLKGKRLHPLKSLALIGIAGIILPFALLETIITALTGHGASLIIHASKPARNP